MKKSLLILLPLYVVAGLFVPAKAQAQTTQVEIRFDYVKQKGIGSNQFAVWIEDARGQYVKTLYSTRFTATGGYKRRAQAIPTWVRQSNLAAMEKAQVDAITSPTPQSGSLRYNWDGTDSEGRALGEGEYRVLVEGTLRLDNRVLYTATIKLGERGQTAAQPQYFGSGTRERGMIGAVTVTY